MSNNADVEQEQKESEQIRQRRANFYELQRLGVTPYPHVFERTDTIAALVDAHGAPVITLAHCTGKLARLRDSGIVRRGTLTRPLVMQAIAEAGGNKTAAAARLGVSRKTIHEYVRGASP